MKRNLSASGCRHLGLSSTHTWKAREAFGCCSPHDRALLPLLSRPLDKTCHAQEFLDVTHGSWLIHVVVTSWGWVPDPTGSQLILKPGEQNTFYERHGSCLRSGYF